MQINLESYSFYIKPGAVDMRKGARSLAYIVQEEMGLAPFSKSVLVTSSLVCNFRFKGH